MRSIILCSAAIVWGAVVGTVWADDGDKTWENTYAIIKTRTPVSVKVENGDWIDVIFPVLSVNGSKSVFRKPSFARFGNRLACAS
jgi:hypothetical protein